MVTLTLIIIAIELGIALYILSRLTPPTLPPKQDLKGGLWFDEEWVNQPEEVPDRLRATNVTKRVKKNEKGTPNSKYTIKTVRPIKLKVDSKTIKKLQKAPKVTVRRETKAEELKRLTGKNYPVIKVKATNNKQVKKGSRQVVESRNKATTRKASGRGVVSGVRNRQQRPKAN